jgi:hypothetical protein
MVSVSSIGLLTHLNVCLCSNYIHDLLTEHFIALSEVFHADYPHCDISPDDVPLSRQPKRKHTQNCYCSRDLHNSDIELIPVIGDLEYSLSALGDEAQHKFRTFGNV